MSKIQEILQSGKAPFGKCGQSPYDPDSVFAKVPKALKQIERGEGRAKRPISAREISKHFGMSVDFIKKTWSKPVVALFLLVCGASLCFGTGTDIQRGFNFTDGQGLTAAQLNNLVDNASILPTFFTQKPSLGAKPAASDYFLMTHGGIFYKALYSDLINNPLVITDLPLYSALGGDYMMFYSNSNSVLGKVTIASLSVQVSSNLNISSIPFTNTINYPNENPNPFDSSNQLNFIVWDTNGVGQSMAYSNLTKTVVSQINSNYGASVVYKTVFNPWSVYSPNTNYTNAWGGNTNFPIASLFIGTNTTQTLDDNDIIPISSTAQNTNTSATLVSIYEYLTNKNTLPPYTLARIQFSGYRASLNISNTANTVDDLIRVQTNSVLLGGNIYCCSVWTNGGVSLWTGIQTNTPYYIVPQSTNAIWCRVFNSHSDAVVGTNFINSIQNSSGITPSVLSYLTNYTSLNADVIQTATASGFRTGIYNVFFRTNSSTSLYYINATVGNVETAINYAQISTSSRPSTNKFTVLIKGTDNNYYDVPLVQVSINPE